VPGAFPQAFAELGAPAKYGGDTMTNKTGSPVAVVTGGIQGLGLGSARHLIGRGFRVAILDLAKDAEPPEELQDAFNEGQCHYYTADIADLDCHDSTLDQVRGTFGRIDCLVNNAGVAARPLTDILDLKPDAFDYSVQVNLRGTFFLSQAFARQLLAAPVPETKSYRSIINITSIAAEIISTDRSQYCVTKSALSMVTRLFATRLAGHGINVHEVRPGFMQTDMTASAGSEAMEEMISGGLLPIPRWGTADDVGQTVASLASGDLPYMTGQPIWTAGGMNIMRAL
jgi:3-oxoacyl-[acyl-carrier protein] reductase